MALIVVVVALRSTFVFYKHHGETLLCSTRVMWRGNLLGWLSARLKHLASFVYLMQRPIKGTKKSGRNSPAL